MPTGESAPATVAELERVFSALGATFLTASDALAERLGAVRGLVFDWDGVFNSGAKGEGVTSSFNEPDSMGLNLLRFALWRRDGALPVTAIISGADNPSARRLAEREHLHAFSCGAKDKRVALQEVCDTFDVAPEGLACIFDDVNDLEMAARCGLRVLIRRPASPLLTRHVVHNGLCDYVTGTVSGSSAIREVMELFLGLMGTFDDTIRARVAWHSDYARYFEIRQSLQTRRLGI